MTAIEGVSPVLPTPFLAGGEIDRASFARVVRRTADLGVGSVMFPGFASEYFSLTDAERDSLLADLLAVADGAVAVIASVSDHATRVAADRTRRYADLGAAMINVLPPHLGGPSEAAVLDHVATVLAAAAPVGVIVQFVPEETGTELTPGQLAALAGAHPNLYAVKVECRSPGRYVRALREAGLPALVGNAGIDLPEALDAGATGVQPGAGFVEVYLDILRRWQAGDRAGALDVHARLARHLRSWRRRRGMPLAMGKAVAWRRGLISHPYCRRPSPTIPARPDDPALAEVDRFIAEFTLTPAGTPGSSRPAS